MKKKILIVEDSASLAEMLVAYLGENPNYEPLVATFGREALVMIDAQKPDAILLDLRLPDMNGMDILKQIRAQKNECAVIVITGESSVDTAVDAMRFGANDFVEKPITPERLHISLSNALEKKELQQIATTYEKMSRAHFCDFIGGSLEMQAVYKTLESAAQSNASVFITGESGTGKELAAHAVHHLSKRARAPLEILNCAAIPGNLLESEIFGHVKGAFTGATSDRTGAAQRANGGTIFLDEIAEMPMDLQSKLLRFTQTGSFSPVGSDKTVKVDVRFVCATNRDPLQAIKENIFREDLYYRLNVIPVHLPALRERDNDVVLLARHFLEIASREEGKAFTMLSPDLKEIISGYGWPGNVRQLENIIRRAVVLNDGSILEAHMISDLPEATVSKVEKPAHADSAQTSSNSFLPGHIDGIRGLKDYERQVIERVLTLCDGNITQAARRLDINPATIHRKQKTWE